MQHCTTAGSDIWRETNSPPGIIAVQEDGRGRVFGQNLGVSISHVDVAPFSHACPRSKENIENA
jgi:hypothetical protein